MSIFILPDLLLLTLRRMRSRLQLTLLALFGVVLAVGLLSSAGFFAQAVDRIILSQELVELSQTTGRQPFAMRVYFFPSARKPIALTMAETVAPNIAGALSGEIGLPVSQQGLVVESSGLMLLPGENDTRYTQDRNSVLDSVTLVYMADVANQMEIVAGEAIPAATTSADNILDVWMPASMAADMGVLPGEEFRVAVNLSQSPYQIRVRGLWRAKDATNPFWFSNPDQQLKKALLIRRVDYIRFAEAMQPAKAGVVSWLIHLDDRVLNPARARDYVTGFDRGMKIVNQFLPGTKLDKSALDPLEKFVQRQSTLTFTLLSFNIPNLGFLLAFLLLLAVIMADWQRREIAVLVSRGMDMTLVLSLTLLEELFLYSVGIPLGLLSGMWLARMMGYTVSFLTFIQREQLPVSGQGIRPWLIVVALVVALLARLTPIFQAARHSVVTQERIQARPARLPWWQRTYLDFLLLLPTYYAYQQLVQRGTLARVVENQPDTLFQDPLLILLPALVIFCAALLSMRLFTLLMRVLDKVAQWMPWTTLHLALRQLSRQGHTYINPILLVITALALGVYTCSLAASLDQWLVDRIYYSTGADVSFLPLMQTTNPGQTGNASEETSTEGLPTETEFSELAGVRAVGRVGRYGARIGDSENALNGQFLGVDRASFPSVAWFRPDFANQSLGGLMNQLALDERNILVSQKLLTQGNYQIGAEIPISVGLDKDVTISGLFKIAGVYTYFPTVYPDVEDETAVIGNLEYLFLQGGGTTFPYHIWLRTDPDQFANLSPDLAEQTLFKTLATTGVKTTQWRDAPAMIAKEQARFERVGIFGTLSVGFLAATLMAVLALLIYSYAALQERLYQFGVLRAIGLYQREVLGQVSLEYALLIAYGALLGQWIGATAAQLFVPFLRTANAAGVALPPLIPIIPQAAILNLVFGFAGLMIVVEVLVIAWAISGRLFAALRMGHQA
ncbi:MAG: ABC transporter permease [Chloroflexi bacterium]|nr:ABC transporter permease [Chloroflexota bacterium]